VDVTNRERRREAGKIFLDLSKYLATLVIVGAFFTKEPVQWVSVIMAGAIAMVLFFVGVKTIAPDKEDK
jgi:predicted phage tail protein